LKKTNRNRIKEDKLLNRDIIWILLFMAVFAGLAFYRIGSTVAPQTYLEFGDGVTANDELILNFNEDVHISRIYFYNGIEAQRQYSFSSYNYETKAWEVLASRQSMGETFSWEYIVLDKDVRSLGIVSMYDKAYLHEIVILDERGRQILPVNVYEYPELFDEQELFDVYVTYFDHALFDEVFHARTAYEFVHHLPVYETSHPPLGKLLISVGIRLFGSTPFGWRFIPALFGIGLVPVIYLFAFAITGKRNAAIFATTLFDCEFMHLTESRIATLDIIIAFFVLLMFYFMYMALGELKDDSDKKGCMYLLLCGMSTACAVSTKWTGAYAAVGIAVCFFIWLIRSYPGIKKLWEVRGRIAKLLVVCIISFLAIPAVVYCLSYIPYTWETGQDVVTIAIENSIHMFTHHSSDRFEHAFSSPWYEWMFDVRPMTYSYNLLRDGQISVVISMGNPIIWWGGLAALVHQFYLWIRHKNNTAGYLCIAYLAMLVPWFFISRTVFIYQYFIPSILLVLMLANSFATIKKNSKGWMIGYAVAAVIVFIMFYPVITGQATSVEYAYSLEWFKTWEIS